MDTGELLFAVEPGGTAVPVPASSLAATGLLERQHLQEWVVAHPQILGPSVMVVAVEYDGWVVAGGPQRDRLDILGLDLDGRLVVAELKRGVAPDTVDMQVIKYAAMASRFRLDTLAVAHASFSSRRGNQMTVDQAAEALQTHADAVSDETLADPRVVVIAQDFTPIVMSSVVWLAERGVDIALVRFRPYQEAEGRVFVTFSQLFPLPDLEKSMVGPGTPTTSISTDQLPSLEWTTSDLIALGRVANPTTRTLLEMTAEKPGTFVGLTEVVEAAGVKRPAARGQLAGLTMTMKRRFGRRNWPFTVKWAADGTQQASYTMAEETARRWQEAVIQLDVEQSDGTFDDAQVTTGP